MPPVARETADITAIGSGMVESGCKLVGAHWGDTGAHYTVNLRAAFLNGAFRPAWITHLVA